MSTPGGNESSQKLCLSRDFTLPSDSHIVNVTGLQASRTSSRYISRDRAPSLHPLRTLYRNLRCQLRCYPPRPRIVLGTSALSVAADSCRLPEARGRSLGIVCEPSKLLRLVGTLLARRSHLPFQAVSSGLRSTARPSLPSRTRQTVGVAIQNERRPSRGCAWPEALSSAAENSLCLCCWRLRKRCGAGQTRLAVRVTL